MFTRKTVIGDRLDNYGPSSCPDCGNSRETIFAGHRLVCRQHPGHPLHDDKAAPIPSEEMKVWASK
jgi:hypothetical protein